MLLPHQGAIAGLVALLWLTFAVPQSKAQANAAVNISELLAAQRYEEALEPLRQLEQRWQAAVRDDDSQGHRFSLAQTLLALGMVEDRLSMWADAEKHLKHARDIAVEGNAGPGLLGDCLDSLGKLLHHAGEYKEATTTLNGAIEQRQQLPLADREPWLSASHNHLGLLFLTMGRYEDAGKIFHETLSKAGDNDELLAQRHSYLGRYFHTLRSNAAAGHHYERALEHARKVWDDGHPAIISLIGQLGLVSLSLGDLPLARSLLTEAAERTAEQPPSHQTTLALATYLNNLGQLSLEEGNPEGARDTFIESLAVLTPRLGDSSPALAPIYNNVGLASQQMGDFKAAKDAFHQAAVRYRYSVGTVHQRYIEANTNLVLNYLLEGELGGEVTKLVEESTHEALVVFDRLLAFGTERQRLNYLQRVDLLSLPCSIGNNPALIADTILRTKGRLLDSVLAEEEESPELHEELRDKQGQLDDLLFRSESRDRLDALRDEIAGIETRIQEERSKSGDSTETTEPGWTDVQASLPRNSAFVDFVRFRDYSSDREGPLSYGAILILPEGDPRWIPLGTEKELTTWLGIMKDRLDHRATLLANQVSTAPALRLQAALRKTYDLFWAPVERHLPLDTETIGLSPDGSLNFVSFAVLLDAEGRFFASKYRQALYHSSGRDLLVNEVRPPLSDGPWAMIAVPDFKEKGNAEAQPSANALDRVVLEMIDTFKPVPGAAEELKLLRKVIPKDARGVELINATEKEIRQLDHSPVVLHLTTHAFFLPTARNASISGVQDYDQQPERLYRSGLVLTEAKRALSDRVGGQDVSTREDGVLYPDEVRSLPLQNTRLVTLSSCDSGLGENVSGEGVLGLRRGFAVAGASDLLISLWPVSDNSTPKFMERIYRLALATDRVGQSLWEAQRLALADVDPADDAEVEEAVLRYGCFVLCQRGPLLAAVEMPELKEPINIQWIVIGVIGGIGVLLLLWPRKVRKPA